MDSDPYYNLILRGTIGLFTLGIYLYFSKDKKNPNKDNQINNNDKEEEKNNIAKVNIINQKIEGKNCHEIPTIKLKMDKKEVQIKCEKEEKIENIPFRNFFKTLIKYKDINCCQFCKNKNPLQKYYLCTNKVLCQNCFEVHNKNDDIIKLKFDST